MLNGYYAHMTIDNRQWILDIGHGYGTGKSHSSKCKQITDSNEM